MSDVVLSCEGISKRFRVPNVQYRTLKGRVLHPFARTTYNEFQALEDVSFEVRRGEFFGIVGRNGSGKSTLLKLIAGIYRADAGRMEINGAIAPFIELGVGFNEELSGRENLFLNGALLGMSRTQLEAQYDEIVEFAELEEFMELKLRNFSSGMQVRLAFSIALQAGADILLTDEVLAVGDERFQRKCFDVFRRQKQRGQTVVFVSHDMGSVGQFCDRGLLLERGRVAASGPIYEVVRAYHKMNAGDESATPRSPGTEVVDAWVEDLDGTQVDSVEIGDEAVIAIRFRLGEEVDEPIVGMGIRDRWGARLIGTNTSLAGATLGPSEPGVEHVARFRVPIRMARGSYNIGSGISWPTPGDVQYWSPDVHELVVTGGGEQTGMIEVPHVSWFDDAAPTLASASPKSS